MKVETLETMCGAYCPDLYRQVGLNIDDPSLMADLILCMKCGFIVQISLAVHQAVTIVYINR